MKRFIEGADRTQVSLLPECVDDYVAEDNPVRVARIGKAWHSSIQRYRGRLGTCVCSIWNGQAVGNTSETQATFRQLMSLHATWVAVRHPWFVQRRSR